MISLCAGSILKTTLDPPSCPIGYSLSRGSAVAVALLDVGLVALVPQQVLQVVRGNTAATLPAGAAAAPWY